MTPPEDCCAGESCYGDPRGLHTHDCPVYLANAAALERLRHQAETEIGAPLLKLPPLPPKWSAPLSGPQPARSTSPPEMQTLAVDGEVLARWDAWQCGTCGSRYGQQFDDHGAPDRCDGELVPVTVTITRRTP